MHQAIRGILRRFSLHDAESRHATKLSPQGLSRQQLVVLGEVLLNSDFANDDVLQSPEEIARKYLSAPPSSLLSSFFDAGHYSRAARRIGLRIDLNADPLLHWLTEGSPRGISPYPSFDSELYLKANPDVRAAGFPAFDHYILYGRDEGRSLGLSGEQPKNAEAVAVAKDREGAARFHGLPEPIRAALAPCLDRQGLYETLKPFLDVRPLIDDQDAAILVAMFDPIFYNRHAGLDASCQSEDSLIHYLSVGILEDYSPSPFFDVKFYRSKVIKADPNSSIGLSSFFHWLSVGRGSVKSPSPLFDEYFYARNNSHFSSDMEMFVHYVLHGVHEGLAPNILFDPQWHSFHGWGGVGERTFLNYLRVGPEKSGPPSRLAAAHAHRDLSLITVQSLGEAVQHISAIVDRYGDEAARLAINLYSPDEPSDLGCSWPSYVSYLAAVAKGKSYSGRLFDPELYRRLWEEGGGSIAPRANPFAHFLKIGRKRRIVPTEMFDEAFYRRTNSDLSNLPSWGFEHFVMHGLFEGRRPNSLPKLAITHEINLPTAFVEADRWRRQFESVLHRPQGSQIHPSPVQRASRILMSDVFQEQMRLALSMEPQIGDPMTIPQVLMPPLHDIAGSLNTSLEEGFPRKAYDTVICVPWLRAGGADLVACLVADSVRRLFPEDSVLLLQTDHPAADRLDWKPEGVDHVDISHLTTSTDTATAERLIHVTLTGLKPKRVINVNSRLTWQTLQRFGRRMADAIDLYAYLFCWDRTPEGVWAGYPSDFYAETAPHMAGVLTDTHYLKDQLIRIYAPPKSLADRIYPLYSPLRKELAATSVARLRVEGKGLPRPQIVWGARMDRQKRFDILTAVARAMPEADFMVWGAPLLDAPPNISSLPSNMQLRGPFKDYEDLRLAEADVWLFTAEWEGLPTILIELGARGMPIVASAVGGVPELIRQDTGWPIDDVEDVSAYVSALREAIANPAERIRRADGLQTLVAARHSATAYDAALSAVLSKSFIHA